MSREKIIVPNTVTREYRKLLRLSHHSVHPIDGHQVRQAFTLINKACHDHELEVDHNLVFHALGVAQLVVQDIGLGTTSVVCALVYRFVKGGYIPLEVIKEKFGSKEASMVNEMLTIAEINTDSANSQAENFRKLLLTMASDVRVILIHLADRLYVMRTLERAERNEQLRIASETFHLYAPLSHRLGLYNLKSELEDLSMKYSNPEMYRYIVKKLEETEAERNKFIREFIAPIKKELTEQDFKFDIKGRVKSIYSIYNKMKKQNVGFEDVYDIFAIRIILDSELQNEKSECWRVFSTVTSKYQPNPQRMRDWISVPKSNGYESLHSTVVVPGGKWVEVQIRTQRMNEIAEKGLAAHWKYKGQRGDQGLDEWLNKIREVLETPDNDTLNFIDDFKLNLYAKEIFVFTPKGDLKKLPKGATVLDFAFDIHSNVGVNCIGAKINGRSVPIRHVLNNGDRVEILTSKNQKPKSDWLDFVVTSKASSKIKASLKEDMLTEAENGKEIFQRRLRNWKITANDITITKIIKALKLKTATDLYYQIAVGKIEMMRIKELITDFEKELSAPQGTEKIENIPFEKLVQQKIEKTDEILVIDNNVSNVDFKFSKCCNPILGDDIFGFVTIHEGIKIHRVNCPNAQQMISRYGYRIIKAQWTGADGNTFFEAGIKVLGFDDIGIVSRITDLIHKDLKVNMRGISIDTHEGMFEGIIRLFVRDTGHLDGLINRILKIKGVTSARRVEA